MKCVEKVFQAIKYMFFNVKYSNIKMTNCKRRPLEGQKTHDTNAYQELVYFSVYNNRIKFMQIPFNKTTPKYITHPPSHDNFLLTILKERCMKLKHIYIDIFSSFAHFVPCFFFFSFYFIVLSSYFSSISNGCACNIKPIN